MKLLLPLLLLGGLEAASLVNNGRSAHSICLSAGAIPSERRAAAELQRFVQEMTGARLPIREQCSGPGPWVYLGVDAAPGLPAPPPGGEAFVMGVRGRNFFIAGGRPRGTLYGVYTFLDGLGCRWFTSDVSRIPKRRSILLPTRDQTGKPAFEYREPFITEAFEKDWAARNRTNGAHQKLDESTGGRVEYFPFVHSFESLVPPKEHFAAHPEYFSLIDGKRRAERSQLCLTNPDVLRLAVERVRAWIREHPAATIISVSQNDWEGWCECDRCRRVEDEEGGAHSGPLLRFVNAVAAEIEKTNPDKLIDTLAYWYTEDPPAKARPRPNVRIRLCPIGVCIAHPYEQCQHSAYFLKNLKAWGAITKQLYIWHYNTNFAHYLAPMPDLEELAADIPLYQRNGVVGLFLEGAYAPGGGGEANELRAYVTARQLWDPAANLRREMDDFLDGVYGKAAPPLRRYYELLLNEVRPAPRGKGQHLWIFTYPEFSPDFLGEARKLLAQAERLAGDGATRRRVRKAAMPIAYMDRVAEREMAIRNGVFAPRDLPGLQQRFQAFVAELREFGVKSIHEGRNLDADEKYVAGLKPYRVTTLQNDAWRVDIMPELSGRVLRMTDKRTGKDLLRHAGPGENGYPDLGGLTLNAHADYVARAWPASWTVESSGADFAVLHGRCQNGIELRRRIELRGAEVVVEAEAANQGPAALELALQLRGDFAPGDAARAALQFQSAGGRAVRQPLIEPEKQPTGNVTWKNGDLPDGVVALTNGVKVQFAREQTARVNFNWTAKGDPRASVGVWSKQAKLQPGEKLWLRVSYGR